MKEEDDYEDYEDEESQSEDSMVLCFGEDGKAEIKMESELEKAKENQLEIISEFIRENLDLFKIFLSKKGISEDDFNQGKIKNEEKIREKK